MTTSTKTPRGLASRDRIEAAALSVFVDRGIDGATTKEIARRAGMAEGNLYRHFTSKDDLAWSVYRAQLERFVASLDALPLTGDARADLAALLHRFRELFESEPDVYAYIVVAHHGLAGRVPRDLRVPPDVVADVLRAGQRSGAVRAGDADLLASMVVGLVAHVTHLALLRRLDVDLDALEREAEVAIWRLVAIGGAA